MVSLFVLFENLLSACHLSGNHLLHLLINHLRGVFAVGVLEIGLLTGRVIITDILEVLAHAVIRHHRICLLVDFLKVIERTGRSLIEENLLSGTTCEGSTHLIEHTLSAHELAFFRQVPRCPQGDTTRHYSNLYQWVGIPEHPAYGSMTRLMISDTAFLLSGHDLVLALQAANDTIDCVHEVNFRNRFLTLTRCNQGRLIAYIGDIGTRESGRLLSKEIHIHIRVQLERTEVNAKDINALLQVGELHVNLTVESSGTEEGWVENLRTVGSRQDDYARVRTEAVHLREQLIER